MQRYFVMKEQIQDNTVTINGDDAHHITNVMRSKIGDKVICSDGESREVLVQIRELSKSTVTATIIEELPMDSEPNVSVWIAQSLPKGDKMESIIQHGTEIGAATFLPFISDRTIVQYDAKKEAKRLERWRKIAKEAAEQAHRNRVPSVESSVKWKELLKLVADMDAAFICYEQEQSLSLKQALSQRKFAEGARIMVIVGPEGGFTEKEIQEAQAAGAASISLGKRILRTETAAFVGLSCILYELTEMGG